MERQLGEGGEGAVYAGLDTLTGQAVAIKLILPATGLGADELAFVRREISTLATLAHPRLARVLEFGIVRRGELFGNRAVGRDGYYVVRTQVEGEDLLQFVRHLRGRAGRDQASFVGGVCALVADALRGLDAIHRAGLRHGDVKPGNFVVDASRRVVAIDFGFSVGEYAPVVGATRAYAAPEVLAGRSADRRADLYAMGVSLAELLDVGLDVERGPALSLAHPGLASSLGAAVVGQLESIFERLCAHDPGERFATGVEAAAALDGVARSLGMALAEDDAVAIPPAKLVATDVLVGHLRRHLGGGEPTPLDPLVVSLEGAPGSGRSAVAAEAAWALAVDGVEPVWISAAGADALAAALSEPGLGAELTGIAAAWSRRAALGIAAEGLVTRARQRPQLIIFDGPGLDSAMALQDALVLAALVGGRGAFAFVVVRTDEAQTEEDDAVVAVRVAPLAAQEVRRLLHIVLGDEDADAAAKVVAATGGNLTLVRHAIGKLARPGSGRDGNEATSADLAAYDAALVKAQPDDALAVLRCLAAVETGTPWLLDLAVATANPKGAVAPRRERAVNLLQDAGLIIRTAGRRVRLARSSVGRAVEAMWSEAARVNWVRALRAALLTRPSKSVVGDSDVSGGVGGRDSDGDHFAAATAGDPYRAGAALDLALYVNDADAVLSSVGTAVERMWEVGELERCAELGERATEVVARAQDALPLSGLPWSAHAAWLATAAEAARRSGRLGVARALATRAIEAASFHATVPAADSEGAPLAALWRARLSLARTADEAGAPTEAIELYDRVLSDDPLAARRAFAARERSRLAIKQGRYDDAITTAQRGLAALAGLSPPGAGGEPGIVGTVDSGSVVADLECALAFAQGMGGDASAEARLWRIAQVAGDSGCHERLAVAETYRAILGFRRGDYAVARIGYEHALAAALSAGDVVRAGTTRMNLATLAFHHGEYGACRGHHARAVRLLVAAGSRSAEAVARKNLGHVLLEIGQVEAGLRELTAAKRVAVGLQLSLHDAGIDALVGIAQYRQGDPNGATLLASALDAFERAGDQRRIADTLLDRVEIELELGATGDVAQISADLLRYAGLGDVRGDVLRDARLAVLCHRADVESCDGKPLGHEGNGAEAVDRALAAVRDKGAVHLLAQLETHAAHAASKAGRVSAAVAYAAAARRSLERIAASLDGERVRFFWRDPRRRDLIRIAKQSDSKISARDGGDPRLWEILDIYRRMASETDGDKLIELAMDTALALTGAERGFLLLERNGALELAKASMRNLPAATVAALHADTKGDAAPESLYSKTIAESVYRTGEAIVSNAPKFDPRLDHARSVHVLSLESVVCVPVFARGQIAGVLYVESHVRRKEFGDAELRLLAAVCDQMAVLRTSVRLRDELAVRAEALASANAKIETMLAERTVALAETTDALTRTQGDLASVQRRILGEPGAYGIVGRSQPIERVFELIDRVAPTEVSVLIRGESGTGKELVARAIHDRSPRRGQPLLAVNCGALPEGILESELFGHDRGAFTGAERRRRGLFEAADGGTLFLDEVGETPMRMQAALLRVLQEGVIRRVGGERDVSVNVRVLCATHRSLEDMVAAGTFREDLFYRLNVVPIELPALRERLDDVPLLVEFFCQRIADRHAVARCRLSSEAMQLLVRHPWPGNVRQLEHVLTAATVMCEGGVIQASDLTALESGGAPARTAPTIPSSTPEAVSSESRREAERVQILEALNQVGWNKAKAARLLQIPRRTFYRRLAEYDIA